MKIEGHEFGATSPPTSLLPHGLAIPMVQAKSVSNGSTGKAVSDTAPGGPLSLRGLEQPLTASGTIKALLHGPRGDLIEVLLQRGTIVRVLPPEPIRLSAQLVGAPLAAWGGGYQRNLGRVIAASPLAPAEAQLTLIAAPPLPPGGLGAAPRPPPPAG